MARLPINLFSFYSDIIAEVGAHESRGAVFAVISWIYRAIRPLTVEELGDVLSLGLPQNEAGGVMSSIESLLHICKGLVVKTRAGTVQFSHVTVLDFLQSECESELLSDTHIAMTCLTYIGTMRMDGVCGDERSMNERLTRFPFSRYAAVHWADHIKRAQDDANVKQTVISTFATESTRDSILQIEEYVGSGSNIVIVRGQSFLHVISEKGLAKVCSFVLSRTRREQRGTE